MSVYSQLKIDYANRINNLQKEERNAKKAAINIDEIMDSCQLKQYLFLGANGLQPYGYTKHSPKGPLFFQYNYLLDDAHPFFREEFIKNLHQSELIIRAPSVELNNLKEEVQSYINSYFTTDPPSCTGYVNKNDTSYVFLFRKDI